MTLLVKSPVWDDLREIALSIASSNPAAAERFLTAVRALFELIAKHPGLGRIRSFSIPGVRSIGVKEFPNYLVFYLPTAMEVQILAVIHGARDLSSALAERLGNP